MILTAVSDKIHEKNRKQFASSNNREMRMQVQQHTPSLYCKKYKNPQNERHLYEGKSLNNRNFILKCMEKYAQRKILFRDTKWLLSNMSYRGRDNLAV